MTSPVRTPGRPARAPALEVRQARRAAAPAAPRPLTRRERRAAHRRRRWGRWGRWSGAVRPSAPASVGGRLLVVVLASVVLAGALLVLSARRVGHTTPPTAGAAGATAAGASGASGSVEAAGTTSVTGVDPGAQAGASPAQVLQGLLDARSASLGARDAALLVRAESAGSPVQAADGALVRRLLAQHQRYDGLAFAAHDVVVESRAGDRVVLRARVARAPYELVGADGTRTPQPGSPGSPWRYVLVRGAAGWRLAEVTAPG